jgi:type IV pilus assembly protein PilB
VKHSPAVKLLDSLLASAVSHNASDAHIEPFENEIRVRFRIHGRLSAFETMDIFFLEPLISRLKIISNMDIGTTREPQEGRFTLPQSGADCRVSVIPTVFGESAVVRIFYSKRKSSGLGELGYFDDDAKRIDGILRGRGGAAFVAGPTGSGKTATLYAFLNRLNDNTRKIITIEDPVENFIDGATQINVTKNLDFETAAPFILRQDPDVIMIGEVRTPQTAEQTIRAAITGHLTLASMHVKDAAGAVTRLLDMGIENYLIAEALRGIIAQRLARELCPRCKKEVWVNNKILNIEGKVFEPVGCERCFGGYSSRFAVYEILEATDEIREMIEMKKSADTIRNYLSAQGFEFIKDCAVKNVKLGRTSIEEALNVIYQ